MEIYEGAEEFLALHPRQTLEMDGCSCRLRLCGPEEAAHTLVFFAEDGEPEDWAALAAPLAERYRVLQVEYPREIDGPEACARVLARLVQAFGIRQAVWAAGAAGGLAAQLIARSRPELVEGLVLREPVLLTENNLARLRSMGLRMKVSLWLLEHLPYRFMGYFGRKAVQRKILPRQDRLEWKMALDGLVGWCADEERRECDLHLRRLMLDVSTLRPVTAADFAPLEGRVLVLDGEETEAVFPGVRQASLADQEDPAAEAARLIAEFAESLD